MKSRSIVALLLASLLLTPLLAAAAFKLPVPEKFTLKNGIAVYYLNYP